MNYIIFTTKDELTGFSGIAMAKNEAEAMRQFSIMANDKETIIGQHPKDFSLYKLGNYDTDNGIIVPDIEKLCDATAVRKSE